ncbi:ABC-three component system middle component 6 [Nocardia aurantiaca]|uniref:ABC-three component system middle component 6 n=1 Tax=Nocardia aurantiaca TaxID=2675850 RepID=UPI00389916E3
MRSSSVNDIFPDKFTPLERSVVGEAANLLGLLSSAGITVGELYVHHRQASPTSTYDSFVAALTLLYGAGVLDYEDQTVRLTQCSSA